MCLHQTKIQNIHRWIKSHRSNSMFGVRFGWMKEYVDLSSSGGGGVRTRSPEEPFISLQTRSMKHVRVLYPRIIITIIMDIPNGFSKARGDAPDPYPFASRTIRRP